MNVVKLKMESLRSNPNKTNKSLQGCDGGQLTHACRAPALHDHNLTWKGLHGKACPALVLVPILLLVLMAKGSVTDVMLSILPLKSLVFLCLLGYVHVCSHCNVHSRINPLVLENLPSFAVQIGIIYRVRKGTLKKKESTDTRREVNFRRTEDWVEHGVLLRSLLLGPPLPIR